MNTNRAATQIRWNEADRGTIHPGYSQEWYEAAKAYHHRVNDPKLQYWSQLVPGRALGEFIKYLSNDEIPHD